VSIDEWQVGLFGTGPGGYAECILTGILDFETPDVLYWYCSPDSSGQWYLYVWLINLFGAVNQAATPARPVPARCSPGPLVTVPGQQDPAVRQGPAAPARSRQFAPIPPHPSIQPAA
jgi:hypothetical protein